MSQNDKFELTWSRWQQLLFEEAIAWYRANFNSTDGNWIIARWRDDIIIPWRNHRDDFNITNGTGLVSAETNFFARRLPLSKLTRFFSPTSPEQDIRSPTSLHFRLTPRARSTTLPSVSSSCLYFFLPSFFLFLPLFSLSLSLSLSLYLPIGVFWEKTLRQRLNSIVTRRVNQKINFTPSETERIRRRPTLRSRVSLSDSVSGWTGFEWIFSLGKTRNWVERLIIKPEEWFNTREFDYFKSFSSRFFDRTVILQHLVLQNDPL